MRAAGLVAATLCLLKNRDLIVRKDILQWEIIIITKILQPLIWT